MIMSISRATQTVWSTLPPFMMSPLDLSQGTRDVEIARQWVPVSGIIADLARPHDGLSRRAHLHISFGPLTETPRASWGARFWEENAPAGAPPIEWLLNSHSPVASVQDALQLLKQTPDLITGFGCH